LEGGVRKIGRRSKKGWKGQKRLGGGVRKVGGGVRNVERRSKKGRGGGSKKGCEGE
jgi:hypothetical protein